MSDAIVIRGRAWIFGADISTDLLSPGRVAHLRGNLDELKKYTLVDAREEFPSEVRPGDLVVAGANFGCGSSREQAAVVLKALGVGAVAAPTFARIFYRNAINQGLPLVTVPTAGIEDGDALELNLAAGELRDLTRGLVLAFPPLPAVMQAILGAGGLVPYIRTHGDLPVGV